MRSNKFEVGDLVVLLDRKKRKRLVRQKNYFIENIDDFGIGIIVDKLEQLFVFPHGLTNGFFEDKTDKPIKKKNLTSTPTNISKVHWIKIEKTRWEYEDDLEHYRVEEPIDKIVIYEESIGSGSVQ